MLLKGEVGKNKNICKSFPLVSRFSQIWWECDELAIKGAIKRHLLNSKKFSRISISAPFLCTNTSSSENVSFGNKFNEMYLDCAKDRELLEELKNYSLEESKNHEPSIKH